MEWDKVFLGDGKKLGSAIAPIGQDAQSNSTGEATQNRPFVPEFLVVEQQDNPEGYLASEALRDAVNVAILLGQPLLLTGEPGTGKTLLARRLAYELGQGEPLTFIARTTSTANDLFYSYDALRRFLAVQNKDADAQFPGKYVTYQALGLAILLAMPRELASKHLPDHYKKRMGARPVVLIDEIDKAPRDLPNDILNEVERMEFQVKEINALFPGFTALREKRVADGEDDESVRKELEPMEKQFKANRPIIILTSNDEKRLPDAFLRRCVYCYIAFPDADTEEGRTTLRRIITNRMPPEGFGKEFLYDDYLDTVVRRFKQIRTLPIEKKPATAELISWMRLLEKKQIDKDLLTGLVTPKKERLTALHTTAIVLAKSEEDRKSVEQFLTNLTNNKLSALPIPPVTPSQP